MVTRRPCTGGFTLLELTLAIVLLSIGLLALVGALARALNETTQARVGHSALRVTESIVDSVRYEPTPAAGSRDVAGSSFWWALEPCASGLCLRVHAAVAADTFSLLAHLPSDAGR